MTVRTEEIELPSGGLLLLGPGDLIHVLVAPQGDPDDALREASEAVGADLRAGEWSEQADGSFLAQCWAGSPAVVDGG